MAGQVQRQRAGRVVLHRPHEVTNEVKIFARQGADRIEQEDTAHPPGQGADCGHGIQQAGGGLVVDQGHPADGRVGLKPGFNLAKIGRFGPVVAQLHTRYPVGGGHTQHALAVDAVVDDQEFFPLRQG